MYRHYKSSGNLVTFESRRHFYDTRNYEALTNYQHLRQSKGKYSPFMASKAAPRFMAPPMVHLSSRFASLDDVNLSVVLPLVGDVVVVVVNVVAITAAIAAVVVTVVVIFRRVFFITIIL